MKIALNPPIAEQPLELLFACHDKVRHFSALCGRVATHIAAQGVDEEARTAAAGILRYFELALPNHHADEEEDVFPALREIGDLELNRSIDAEMEQHKSLDQMWQQIRPWLTAIAEGRMPGITPLVLPRFVIDYPNHAQREEREIFSALVRLPLAEIDRIAFNMRARRGA